MNAPITRLFVGVLILFAGLVGATSWWTVVRAEEAQDNPLNARELLRGLEVERGDIRAGDTTVARSVPFGDNAFQREYAPQAEAISHALGYYYPLGIGSAGTERFRDDPLSGQGEGLGSLFDQIAGAGGAEAGDDVALNLDLAAQRVALQQLGGRKGAVVAMEPDTGRVRVMASVPGFDPGSLEDEGVFTRLSTDEDNSPLVNRATQSLYPPGSTFKVVTAVAAIDSGRFTPDSTLDGSSPQIFSATPLNNFGGQSFGPVTLTQALTQSVNTVWARVGEQLGGDTMTEYMERFGLYERPPIDLPRAQVNASGVFGEDGEPVRPSEENLDLARIAIGQAGLLTTPLQMAMVASAVGNDGVLMEPRITRRVVDRDGRTVEDVEPERVRRVMSRETSDQVTQMMRNVVQSGSGTAATLQGTNVAGKTGTAEIDIQNNINQLWFIAFAPSEDPEVAIAVTVERAVGGQGGQVAAPIARAVLESLLG